MEMFRRNSQQEQLNQLQLSTYPQQYVEYGNQLFANRLNILGNDTISVINQFAQNPQSAESLGFGAAAIAISRPSGALPSSASSATAARFKRIEKLIAEVEAALARSSVKDDADPKRKKRNPSSPRLRRARKNKKKGKKNREKETLGAETRRERLEKVYTAAKLYRDFDKIIVNENELVLLYRTRRHPVNLTDLGDKDRVFKIREEAKKFRAKVNNIDGDEEKKKELDAVAAKVTKPDPNMEFDAASGTSLRMVYDKEVFVLDLSKIPEEQWVATIQKQAEEFKKRTDTAVEAKNQELYAEQAREALVAFLGNGLLPAGVTYKAVTDFLIIFQHPALPGAEKRVLLRPDKESENQMIINLSEKSRDLFNDAQAAIKAGGGGGGGKPSPGPSGPGTGGRLATRPSFSFKPTAAQVLSDLKDRIADLKGELTLFAGKDFRSTALKKIEDGKTILKDAFNKAKANINALDPAAVTTDIKNKFKEIEDKLNIAIDVYLDAKKLQELKNKKKELETLYDTLGKYIIDVLQPAEDKFTEAMDKFKKDNSDSLKRSKPSSKTVDNIRDIANKMDAEEISKLTSTDLSKNGAPKYLIDAAQAFVKAKADDPRKAAGLPDTKTIKDIEDDIDAKQKEIDAQLLKLKK